jgi:signal transduction protein with GAF and PtsI domain
MTDQPRHDRIQRAVADLAAAGRPVTFTAVATATGVSRATLYRHPELRAAVEDHRTRPTASALAAEIRQLRTALEAVAAKTRRHEERLRRLERHRVTASP